MGTRQNNLVVSGGGQKFKSSDRGSLKMNIIKRALVGAGFLALLNLGQAQQAGDSAQTDAGSETILPTLKPNGPIPSIANAFADIKINDVSLNLTSVADIQTLLEALQADPPVAAASLPKNRLNQVMGTAFWSLKNPYWPPLPGIIHGESVWPIGNGRFIIDDRLTDYAALQAEADAEAALTAETSQMMRMSSLSTCAYGNAVYLTNMMATLANNGSMTAAFAIGGGTNFVPYDILMVTNLVTPIANWNWIGIGYTSNNYTFYEQPARLGFYMLAKPSKTMTVGFGNDSAAQCDVPFGVTNALQVAGGGGQSLVLKNDGKVVAWGQNYYGQANVPTNLAAVAMISAGWYHSVALLTNGTVTAWGLNIPAFGYPLTAVPSDLTNAVVISAQALHTLALRTNGTVVAWGYNTYLGETNVPAGLTNVTAISAGYQFNLAVTNGFVVAWGDNSEGQCNVPAGLSNVVDVAAGTFHSVALLKNGTVVAWGDNFWGQTNVPAGLTNVVAIAASGDPAIDTAYSMALKSDGTVVTWGNDEAVDPVLGLNNVIGIAAGADHALAVRTGPRTPVITLTPFDQYQITNGTVTFSARGAGLYGVTYQWQTNGVNIVGATNVTLTVSNVQPTQLGGYNVVVKDNAGAGSIVSSNVYIHLVSTPGITSQTLPTTQFVLYQSILTLNASASATGQFNGFPLSYQWQFNGTNISGANSASYTFTVANSGTYSLIVSNVAGSVSVAWQITVVYPGGVIGWGSNSNNQLNASSLLTNVISLAAGKAHGIVALDSGSVSNWGSYWTGTNYVAVTGPPPFTKALAVAAGARHDLVLKTDGTLVAWGFNDFGQTNVPANTTNVTAIAAGGSQSLALLKNQTVVQWGQTNAQLPAGLTNVTAIAAGTNFALALQQNSTVIAWGMNDYGQTNIPAGLSNVVAIAAGGSHALALKNDGIVMAWGSWTNVPANLSNAMNVAAGENQNIALKNDGTVIVWGDNTFGQTNGVSGLTGVKLIAGGGEFSLAIQFSMTAMYPVDVTKDLLLIYNTNSVASTTVENYYLQNRPMMSGANVLGINCTSNETILPSDFTNLFVPQIQSWLAANPTKRPQYVVLFNQMPSRVNPVDAPGNDDEAVILPSVQYQIYSGICSPTWNPFVTSLNMNGFGTISNCLGYITKLAQIATNYSPGKLLISASAGGYNNTNYILDNVRISGLGENLSYIISNGIIPLI